MARFDKYVPDDAKLLRAVGHLSDLEPADARTELSEQIDAAHTLEGEAQIVALSFNAHLVTAIREAKLGLWDQ